MSLAPKIDGYLQSKGSPLTGYGRVFVQAGRKYGVDPRLLVAIAGAESSFGKYKPIQSIYNAWGWGPGKAFASWDDAIHAVARGLGENYIRQGLTTIPQISSKYAPIHAANDPTNLNVNWTRTVTQFYKELGGSKPSARVNGSSAVRRPLSVNPSWGFASAQQGLADLASGRYSPTRALQSLMMEQRSFDTSRPSPATSSPVFNVAGGDFLNVAVGGTKYSNLGGPEAHAARPLGNWQSDNAWDLGVPVGTPIYAVDDGVVGPGVGVQGSRPNDGARLTLNGASNNYWYGHLSQVLVQPGQRVRRGQLLGYSGTSQNGVPHLHLGVQR